MLDSCVYAGLRLAGLVPTTSLPDDPRAMLPLLSHQKTRQALKAQHTMARAHIAKRATVDPSQSKSHAASKGFAFIYSYHIAVYTTKYRSDSNLSCEVGTNHMTLRPGIL